VSVWVRVVCGIAGFAIQLVVLDAAVRTFLLPRVANVRLSKYTARSIASIFRLLVKSSSYATKDHVLSLFPSITLLMYEVVWMSLSAVAFALIYVSAGASAFSSAFATSGSTIVSLGVDIVGHGSFTILECVEAGIGLTLLALLIAFIPTLYQSFQRREYAVSRLTVRAGIPATPWGVLEIAASVDSYARLDELWREWEQWFIDVGETHTTVVILNYYRSPDPKQTWIGGLASVLDAAALFQAAVDAEPSPTAGLCIRAGWLNLRRIADYFQIPYPTDFQRKIPISISREEFEIVLDRLARVGVPILADRDTAWRDFHGWRVNYDRMVESFYTLFTCPRTDWRTAAMEPLVGPSNLRGME
jgi:hypothetical protein